jgi:uncharacterized HhH-GPD family protein
MVEVYERARSEAGYVATRFIQMVAERGGIQAAKQLLNSAEVSDGFVALWERGRLDLAVESVILRPEFHELFTDDERAIARRRLDSYGYRLGPAIPEPSPSAPAAPTASDSERLTTEGFSRHHLRGVVDALLDFARSHAERQPVGPPSLTPDPAANEFVLSDPFAFLVAVIFDQQINFERAWQAPYELRWRMGHLDPDRIVGDPQAVQRAVAQPPALHRYVVNVPSWVVQAAQRVLDEYEGNAGVIWGDEPTAAELQRRLIAFAGIGQKKAAMAVEILERDLGVRIQGMEGSDIAYDIHVRRVFLRTGLAERDDPVHMVQVARSLYPERPGALDDPAWRVGRLWCHAGVPDCPRCPLRSVCPKLVDKAASVASI